MKLSVPIYQLKRLAKKHARDKNIALCQALDFVAQKEGFKSWSFLASQHAQMNTAAKVLNSLKPGELVLLGARRGHGKTMMALEIISEAIQSGWNGVFYSLEFTGTETRDLLETLSSYNEAVGDILVVDTSDDICADYIVGHSGQIAKPETILVVDYLQLLDQKRSTPPVSEQVAQLKSFAAASGATIILISQIHRSFETSTRQVPTLMDIRQPNELDLSLFAKSVFVHEGKLELHSLS